MIRRAAVEMARAIGRGAYNTLIAVLTVAMIASAVAVANYTGTQGVGTTFASLVISATHYAAMVLCDATVGESQCLRVQSNGAASVDAGTSAATTPVAISAASLPLPTGAATSANQSTAITDLGNILTAVQGAIPAGTNTIGSVNVTSVTSPIVVEIAPSVTPITTNSTPALATTSGWSSVVYGTLSNAANTIKASAGQVGLVDCYNPGASVAYANFYSGAPTLATTTPIHSVPVPAASSGGFAMPSVGVQFGTDIRVAAGTTPVSATAPTSPLVCSIGFN